MPAAYVIPRKGRKRRKWAVKVYLGEAGGGKKEKWFSGFESRAAAIDFASRNLPVLGGVNAGAASDPRLTLTKYFRQWLIERKGELRPRTWDRYDELARVHIVPELGHLPLMRVQAPAVKQALLRRGRPELPRALCITFTWSCIKPWAMQPLTGS